MFNNLMQMAMASVMYAIQHQAAVDADRHSVSSSVNRGKKSSY
jgi:hypothetical protein